MPSTSTISAASSNASSRNRTAFASPPPQRRRVHQLGPGRPGAAAKPRPAPGAREHPPKRGEPGRDTGRPWKPYRRATLCGLGPLSVLGLRVALRQGRAFAIATTGHKRCRDWIAFREPLGSHEGFCRPASLVLVYLRQQLPGTSPRRRDMVSLSDDEMQAVMDGGASLPV